MKLAVAVLSSFLLALPAALPAYGQATLTAKVKSTIAADVGLKHANEINVDSENGVVTLQGSADTAETKRLAEKAARKVSGVKDVKNQIQVGKKGG